MAAYKGSTKAESLTSGTFTLTYPSVSAGDLLVVTISGHAGTASTILSCNPPAGWTRLDDASAADNAKLFMAVFAKIWQAGDPTSNSWTVSSTANTQGSHAICAAFSGPGPIADMNLALVADNLNPFSITYAAQTNAAIVLLVATHCAGDANAAIPALVTGFTSCNTEQTAGTGNYTHSTRLQYKVVDGDIGPNYYSQSNGDTAIAGSFKIPMVAAAGGGGLFWGNNF